MKSLYDLYEENEDNVSDKWLSYLQHYNKLLKPYRDQPVRILEIGVQNGGSLDIWAKFFPKATHIVGCDIDPKCSGINFTSPLVKMIIGDAKSDEVLAEVAKHSDTFDIIIDDGSHTSSDIIRTFAKAFPMISDGGLYICEDLHCSYFKEFEGGLEDPNTSQSFFRRLSDYVNHQHWTDHYDLKAPLMQFEEVWEIEFPTDMLYQIHSVNFSNSICHIEKKSPEHNLLQHRIVRGQIAVVDDEPTDPERVDYSRMPTSGLPDSAPHGSIERRARKYAALLQELEKTQKKENRETDLRIETELNYHILSQQHQAVREELALARRKPLEPLKDKIKYKILRGLINSGLPLPEKIKARFDKSSRKRDPKRSLYDTTTSHDREDDYDVWMRTKELTHHLSADQITQINAKAKQAGPMISIVMPVYNPAADYLEKCILSVLNQSFQNWQFCIADDASTDPEIRPILEKYAALDSRVQIVFRPENGHISAASNSALEIATGDFIALLDHDDMLTKHALSHMAQTIQNNPNAQLIYSDEDKLNDDHKRVDPHFKGDWNRDLFYTHNYITHLSVLDRKIINEIRGFRLGFEGAQDYDLLLRAVALIKDENIIHLSKVLYHWRAHSGSTAQTPGAKSYTHDAGKKALIEFLQDQENADITVDDGMAENLYHVIWPLPKEEPKVSIIIPTRDHKDILETAVTSILEKTAYQNYEIIIVDNGSIESDTLAWFETVQAQSIKIRVLPFNEPFNYSAINNFAVAQTDSEIIALVNNDVEIISPSWLREMVSHAIRKDIGCVGAKLHYTNGQIQHGGVIIGIGGMAGHSHKLYAGTHHGYFGRLFATQNLSAVTGACLVMKRSIYEEVNGLNADNLAVAFNDVDLCLKVQAAGYRNLWSPYATLFHHESISRGEEDTPEKRARFQKEAEYMIDKWKPLENPDRYYSPNLTLTREDFSIDI